MKLTPWHLTAGLLAGVIGYGLGLPGSLPPAVAPSSLPAPSGSPLYQTQASWKSQLSDVRKSSASRSETAWVKWAFAVPDAEIPAAIAGLNPRADFHAMRVLFSRWVQLDAAAAWKAFDALPVPEESSTWYEGSSQGDLNMANSSFQNNPRNLIIGRMLHSWHRTEPAAAVAFAEKLKTERATGGGSTSGYSDYQITRFLKEKAPAAAAAGIPQDPAAEAALALALPAPGAKRTALGNTLEKWAGQDADAAARWWIALPDAERSSLDLSLSAGHLFRQSSPALKSEILTSGLRASAISQENFAAYHQIPKGQEGMHPESYNATRQLRDGSDALNQWAVNDPAAVKSWLANQSDDPVKSFLTGELAGSLSRTSPRDAIALLADLPDEALPVAVAGLTAGWLKKDASACAAWVAQIDDPATREACQQTMARAIMASDPALALRISTQISDDTARQQIQKTITDGLSWNPAGLEKMIASDPQIQASLRPAGAAASPAR